MKPSTKYNFVQLIGLLGSWNLADDYFPLVSEVYDIMGIGDYWGYTIQKHHTITQ